MWADVIKGIVHNNEEEALEPKRKLEVIQRREEAERREKNIEWVPKHFVVKRSFDSYGDSWVYEKWDEIIKQIQDHRNN